MAWTGSAQGSPSQEISLRIEVIETDKVGASFTREVDVNHCGIQIKLDILETEDKHEQIPKNMRMFPEDCELFLCDGEKKFPIANYDRLSKYSEYFSGCDVRLQLLSPGSCVEGTELKLTDLGVHKV